MTDLELPTGWATDDVAAQDQARPGRGDRPSFSLRHDVQTIGWLTGARFLVGVLSMTTGGDLTRCLRWDELLGPARIGDELSAALVADGRWR